MRSTSPVPLLGEISRGWLGRRALRGHRLVGGGAAERVERGGHLGRIADERCEDLRIPLGEAADGGSPQPGKRGEASGSFDHNERGAFSNGVDSHATPYL
jgi:hypothetical protein